MEACSCALAQKNTWQDLSSSNSGYIARQPTPVPQGVAAPSDLTATATSLTDVELAWVNNAQYQDGQIVQRCSGSSCVNFANLVILTPAQQGITDTTAVAGTTYSYRILSFFGATQSSWSNTASLTMPSGPAAPTLFSATVASDTQINLAWTDNSSNEDGFKIERCTGIDCADFAQITTAAANATSLNNTGLTAETIYCYRTRAYNAYADSVYSNEAGDETDVAPAGGITFLGVGAEGSAASGNITLGTPASPASNDIWLASIHSSDQVAHTLTDWTQLYQANGGGTTSRFSVWYFRYAGSTPNLIVGHTAGATIVGGISAWRGVKTTGSPVNVANAGNSGNDTTMEHTSITPSVNDCMIVALSGQADDNSTTPHSGYTAVFEDSVGGTQNCLINSAGTPQGAMGQYYLLQTTAAATGTITTTGLFDPWGSYMLALEPQ